MVAAPAVSPVAADDFYTTYEDTALTIPAPGMPAIVSPTPVEPAASPSAQTTENTSPMSWWQSWMLYAAIIGVAIAAIAGYLVLFRRSG